MKFTLSVFDVLSNAIPGGLQIGLFCYVAWRLDWFPIESIGDVNSAVLLVVGFGASILLGQLTYPAGQLLSRLWARGAGSAGELAQADYRLRHPEFAGRAFLEFDDSTLLAGVRLELADAADQIGRLRATALMLKSSAVPLGLGAVVSLVEVFASEESVATLVVTALLATGAGTALSEGRKFSIWAISGIFEHAAWLPDPTAPPPPRT